MDLQIRPTDPLPLASHGVPEDLVDKIGHSALLLTAFRGPVLCIAECRGSQSPANRFRRGQQRLAHLPYCRLKAIYARQVKGIENAGPGSTWGVFRKTLGGIRKGGTSSLGAKENPCCFRQGRDSSLQPSCPKSPWSHPSNATSQANS